MDHAALNKHLSTNAGAVTAILDELLCETDEGQKCLMQAMRYATLGGGKRIRPFLVCASAKLFGIEEKRSLRVAAAIEMVHCYSLVHDDLPAMDDDDLRRGKPTCHVKYDEATAILAGDALLTRAFEVLADEETSFDPGIRSSLVAALAKSAGCAGMVGGQMIDLGAENAELTLEEITQLQRMKTGALIAVSCEMGAIMGQATYKEKYSLNQYANDIGLAFQIVDDLLDITGNEVEVGKKIQKDAEAGKATFVSLMGLDAARQKAEELSAKAQERINVFGSKAAPLKALANFIVNRRS